jgi:endonuclease/exonuclease/phosphatase family metal-dependent hydrolase
MRTLVVATFNIRHGRGLDGRVDLGRTADAIAQTNAEVIALQEVDRGHERSGRLDQVARLEELTGLHIHFSPTVVRDGFEYGIALASRSAVDTSYLSLPRLGDEEPRGAIAGEVEGMTFLTTHLATKRSARTLHLRALGDLARDARPPVVVMGDLNAGARGIRSLRGAGLAGGPRIPTTMARSRRRVDWILAGAPARLAEAHTIPTDASDHLPLVATLEVPGP